MNEPILMELCRVCLTLGAKKVLDDINLAIHKNEIVTVIGPNGGGKSSLLRILAGIVKPDSGKVERSVSDLVVGYVPQSIHINELIPVTAEYFIGLGLDNKVDDDYVATVFAITGVERFRGVKLHSLSGGELRYILLARALLLRPALLILDEPTSSMDIKAKSKFARIIEIIKERLLCSIVLTSHDLHVVMRGTNHVICMNNTIHCCGTPHSVRNNEGFAEMFGNPDEIAVYSHEAE